MKSNKDKECVLGDHNQENEKAADSPSKNDKRISHFDKTVLAEPADYLTTAAGLGRVFGVNFKPLYRT